MPPKLSNNEQEPIFVKNLKDHSNNAFYGA